MNLLESAEQLKTWDAYRDFLKKQLKMLPDEGICFVSKEKLDFDIEGKPWRGHAILVGPKAVLVIKKLRAQGTLFRDGRFKREGKVLAIADLLPKLVKEAEKTLLKLKLGWKVAAADEGGSGDVLLAALKKLKAGLAPHIEAALSEESSIAAEVKVLVQRASGHEKTGDLASGVDAMKQLGALIAGGAVGAAGGIAAGAAAGAAAGVVSLKPTGKSIRQDVGAGGKNEPSDVVLVQHWLNDHGVRVKVSGTCDAATIKAIRTYQGEVLKFKQPDGLVEPRGTTERNLKRKPVEYDGKAETETEQKLKEFFGAFDGIAIRTNPGKQPAQYVDVVPPYHINGNDRKKNALAARKKNSAINSIIKKMPALARVGKADPDDIKFFLDESVKKGLVKDMTPKGFRNHLAKYGVSTDCSGLVGQALNYLTDGNLDNEKGDPIDLMNTGADSMKGGAGKFSKVTKPAGFKAGDTMHTPKHIRILVDVDRDGDMVLFRTVESTPREDVIASSISDGRNNKQAADGGVGDILWRYDDANKLSGLQRSADGGKTWKRAKDSNVTYGRWKSMPAGSK